MKKIMVRQTSWEFENKMIDENENKFDEVLATAYPELYILWEKIKLYQINTKVLSDIVRLLGELGASVSKTGKIIIDIEPDKVTGEASVSLIRGIENCKMNNEPLLISFDNRGVV